MKPLGVRGQIHGKSSTGHYNVIVPISLTLNVRFNRHCTLGITFSSSATITSVLSILLASLSERETNTVHEIDAWWRWFKVIVLAAIIMAVLGTQQTLEAYRFWMIMTIPNEYVEKHGCEGFKATYGPDMSDVTNSWGYTFMCSVFLSNSSLIITIVFSSLGSAARYVPLLSCQQATAAETC